MSSVKVSDFATGLACTGFVVAAAARVAVDYLRFHGTAPAAHWPLDVIGPMAIIVGTLAYLIAIRQFIRLRSAAPVSLIASGVLGLLVVGFGLVIGLGLYTARAGFSGEARLAFDMAMHALIAAPALAALALWHRSGQAVAA